MPTFLTKCRRFASDETGNIAIMFGLTAVVLLTTGGLAVEVSRAMTERSAMANALDAAVLATARSISLGEITRDQAEVYLNGMFAANLNVPAEDLAGYQVENIAFDEATKTLTANGARNFDTMFRFFGDNNALTLRTSAAAIYGTSYAEVAMTFDITGSMRGAKLQNLKTAAIEGVTQLLGDGDNSTIRISAIPYAESVNVGSLSRYVFPDDGGADTVPPSNAELTAAMESDEEPEGIDPDAVLGGSSSNGGRLGPDDCATERKGDYIYENVGPDVALVNRDKRLDVCSTAPLMPLTNDARALVDAITAYRDGGVTAGQIGIQWAWYMLSPEWADFVPAGSKPMDPETSSETIRKYAVIMTDGEFNTAFAGSSRSDPQMNEGRLSTDHALELCRRMKDEGISIFTIGFQLQQTRAIEMLRDCATPQNGAIQYFFDASSAADLTNAYRDIAATIQALRLVR